VQGELATTQTQPPLSQQPARAGLGEERFDGPSTLQSWLAVSVIALFIAMLVGLAFLRADQNWDRLIYLLSGFEAIVFAAAGLVFGATISRRITVAAREDADRAKAEATHQQAVAEQHMQGNLAGEALAKAVLAKAEMRIVDGHLNPDVVELAFLAISLSPDLVETPRVRALREVLLRLADRDR
jgi:hypothetical protein